MKSFTYLGKSVVVGTCLVLVPVAPLAGVLAAQEQTVTTVVVQPTEAELRAFITLVRADVLLEKASIIAENMVFTEDEAFDFWNLYGEYSAELNKLLDERLALIRKHVDKFAAMTDEQAKELAKDVFDLEAKRLQLKRDWFAKFSLVIPAKKAAQFFQIENQLNAALDLRVAAMLPLIQ